MSKSESINDIVSFDTEQLILVNENDEETGTLSKALCHDGDGVLHRAFSLFIFNDDGQLLLQRRSADKRLWPLFWSNSCCSHPRKGEEIKVAVGRRLQQELGMSAELCFVYKFTYQAKFGELGSEYELCSVFLGRSNQPVVANETEIAEWQFISPMQLTEELNTKPGKFTPWFKMEWSRLNDEYSELLAAYCGERG
jgi:isopentenyl-diphosphate delta-isomerase